MLQPLYDQSVLWQMSAAERMAMFYLMDRMPRRSVALEIGSYKGGFTKELVQKFDTVVSIDIDHSNLKVVSPNLVLVTGNSQDVLPAILQTFNPDFILIDGDHSYEGVLADLHLTIKYAKGNPIILLHDAAYSETKTAIEVIAKQVGQEYFVDIDFVPGVPFNEGKIGGLALFIKKDKITEL